MDLPELHPFNLETHERVGAIVLDANENLLVIEGVGGRLSLPKGCRHWGETEWDGAMRECYEETGVDLEDPLLPVTLLRRNVKLRWGTYQEVRVRLPGYQVKTLCQEGESVRVFWVNPSSKWIRSNPACNADLKAYVASKKDLWRGGSRQAPLTMAESRYVDAGCAPEPLDDVPWIKAVLTKEQRREKGREKRLAQRAQEGRWLREK